MPIDFTTLTPTATEMPADTRGRQAADRGPNPWLDNGWLLKTYESGIGDEVTVPGKYETYTGKVRATGEEVQKEKITGDAALAVQMIRDAADKLSTPQRPIGVRIVVTEAKRKGQLRIQYLGQTRKAPRKTKSE